MMIQVRPAVASDVRAIARINVNGWLSAYRGIVSDSFLAGLSAERAEQRWRERIAADPGRSAWVAVREGAVLGYCALETPSRDEDAAPGVAEVRAIYVDPHTWRTGAGSALMTAALASLREDGWQVATLWVFEANSRARAFYERFGFTRDGSTRTHAEVGIGVVEIRLRLEL